MSKYLYILILLISWTSIRAQTEEDCAFLVKGLVIDTHDHSNLGYATIYLVEPEIGVVADSNGYFELNNICGGEYTLVVSHVSCQPDTISLTIRKDIQINLQLEHHAEALNQIIIIGQGLQSKTNSGQERMLGIEKLGLYGHKGLGNLLKMIPGVAVLNTGNTIAKPMIQGLYGSRIITVNHGVRMNDMEWGDEHASTIDINTAGNISVINGGSALRYGGDAVGGVVVVEPRPIPKDTLIGRSILHGATNGRGGGLTMDITKGFKNGWFGKLQGSVKRFGDFEAPDYSLTNTGMSEKGISFLAGKQTEQSGFNLYYSLYDTDIAILSASHIGNTGDLVDAIEDGDPQIIESFSYEIGLPRQEVTHQLARLQYNRKANLGELQFQYDFQHNHRLEFDKRVGDDRDKASIDLELITHAISGDLTFNQNGRLPIETGIVYRYEYNFANPDTGIRRLIPDYDKYQLGFYFSGDMKISETLIADAGVRYDFSRIDAMKFYQKSRWEERRYDEDFSEIVVREFPTQLLTNPRFDYHSLSYALGVKYYWRPQIEARINYSYAQRAPNPSELFSDGLHHGAARIELGDLRIVQEGSHKLGLSINAQHGRLAWDLTPYVNFIQDFVVLEPVGVEQTIRGAFPVWEYMQNDARIWGFDGQARVQWNDQWSTNHDIMYVNGQNTTTKEPLIYIPAPQFRNSLSLHNPNWHQLEITMESSFTFEQKRYPNNNFLVFIPESNTWEEVEISKPPPSYHLLNIYARTEFRIFKNQTMGVGLAVNNLFNTRYRDYLNRLRFFADELGRSFEITLAFNF